MVSNPLRNIKLKHDTSGSSSALLKHMGSYPPLVSSSSSQAQRRASIIAPGCLSHFIRSFSHQFHNSQYISQLCHIVIAIPRISFRERWVLLVKLYDNSYNLIKRQMICNSSCNIDGGIRIPHSQNK